MSDSESFVAIVGIVVLSILVGIAITLASTLDSRSMASKVYDAVRECERSLPRDQVCGWEVGTYVKGVSE